MHLDEQPPTLCLRAGASRRGHVGQSQSIGTLEPLYDHCSHQLAPAVACAAVLVTDNVLREWPPSTVSC
jgi:hypothetical protein